MHEVSAKWKERMIPNCPFCKGTARLVDSAAIYVTCTDCGARSRQITPRRIVTDATMRKKYGKYSEYEYKAELKLREKDIKAEHDRCVGIVFELWNRRNA